MIDFTILIDCPDEYLDILRIFFWFLQRNWNDCPAQIVITTNTQQVDCPINVSFVKCGFGLNSIERSNIALSSVKTDYLLIIDCDCFIFQKVDTLRMNSVLLFLKENNASYCRLWREPNTNRYKTTEKSFFRVDKKQRYGKSLMANIWLKTSYINDVISLNLNGWETESFWLKETAVSQKGYELSYFVCKEDPLSILHGVYKGKWIRIAVKKALKSGVPSSLFDNRELISRKTEFKIDITRLLRMLIPSSWIRVFKRIAIVFGIKFATPY